MNRLKSYQPRPSRAQTPGRTRRAPNRARRADRLPRFIGLKGDPEAALDQLSVAVVGIGSVGASVAFSLARLQIGQLTLIDRGTFKPASLLTQPVGPECLGRPKASHIAEHCRAISGATRVRAWDCSFEEVPWSSLHEARIVVLAGDNLSVAREVGQRCLHLGLPLIHAAVHGDTLTAQCRFFGAHPQDPCPVCLFGPVEFRMLEEEQIWSCEGRTGTAAPVHGRALNPTRSVRSACALAGHTAALCLLRWALGLGAPLQNTMTEICAYTWRTFVTPLLRNPECPCLHELWKVCTPPAPLRDLTPAELMRPRGSKAPSTGSGQAPPADWVTLTIPNHHWVERGLCACAEAQPVQRFVRKGEPAVARCRRCGRSIFAQPFYSHDHVSAKVLGPSLHKTLGRLGARAARDARIDHAQETVLFVQPESCASRHQGAQTRSR